MIRLREGDLYPLPSSCFKTRLFRGWESLPPSSGSLLSKGWPAALVRKRLTIHGAPLEKPIEQVLKEHSESLMAFPGVVGVAQGLSPSNPHIKVYVARKTPTLLWQIPSEIEGYSVVVEETGEFRKLDPG